MIKKITQTCIEECDRIIEVGAGDKNVLVRRSEALKQKDEIEDKKREDLR